MRIAVLAPLVTPIAEPQLGGSQVLVADLARGLAVRGHDVRVYAASGSRIEGVTVVDTGVDPARLSETLFRAGGSSPAPPEAAARAREAFAGAMEPIRQAGPDVVHVHAFDAPAVEASARIPCPVIHVLHLPPAGDVASAVRRAHDGRGRRIAVTVSRRMGDAWAAAGVTTEVIRNGVPVDRIPWDPRPGPGGVLFAGRLSPEKGALEALEIARLAGLPVRLAGGPYDPEYARRVASAAASTPGSSVEGPVTRRRLWQLMGEARAVLCPIRWDEPFGLVAAEAQAAGAPVVGFRRGALPEVVDHGVTGALVPEGDLEAAADEIRRADRFDRTACRRHAERTLDIGRTIDAYEALSLRAIGDAATPGAVGADR